MKNYPTVPNSPIGSSPSRPRGEGGSFFGLRATDRAAHEEILHGAYLLWESEGRPENRALANWLQAEIAVMSRR